MMKKLSPPLKAWLEEYHHHMKELLAAGFLQTPENNRKGMETLTSSMVTRIPEVSRVLDGSVDGPGRVIPVRMYHPAPETELPVLIYLHGGGHMVGSVAVYDPICRTWPSLPDISLSRWTTDWPRSTPTRPGSKTPGPRRPISGHSWTGTA